MPRATAVALALLLAGGGGRAQPAAEAGFAPDRLARLHAFLAEATGERGYLGAVELIARDGRIVDWRAFGHRDLARQEPMKRDAIFRIYSMTKTIATVAVLMLVEEGRLGLDDPVARHLPVFADLAVVDRAGATPRAPRRALTLRHLLTHTAGFAYGRIDVDGATDLADYAARVARAPLGRDPGERFAYDGVNTEVACRIVEVVSGQPFDRFVQRRILAPLKMTDTGFSVPAAQRHRVVDITTMGAEGHLVRAKAPEAGTPMRPYPSGAGGLYSTAADYQRFAQMLLNGGTLDGVRLLKHETVDSMMRNQLAGMIDPPTLPDSPGEGFGLGGSVLLDPAKRGRLGSVGQFSWTGAATTWYTVDPSEHLVAILLMQHLPRDDRKDLARPYAAFQNLVYQALVR